MNKCNYVELNWTEQVGPVTRHVHWSRRSQLYFPLIGCSETRTVSARLVLNTCIPTRLFAVQFVNWRSVQFMRCEQAFGVRDLVRFIECCYGRGLGSGLGQISGMTARGVAHLVVHGTSGSTSYETIPHVRLETSRDVLSTVDMVVQRRDGPRRLCDSYDDDGVWYGWGRCHRG